MTSRRLHAAILLVTLAGGFVAVLWADREFRRVEPPSEIRRSVTRPDWVWALNRPYRRFQHDWTWACVAATAGLGTVVALEARGRSRPGAVVVLVALIVGVASAVHYLLAAPPIFRITGACYGLSNAFRVRVPGAILGAWAVAWGHRMDWRALTISAIWLVQVAMLVAYGILFG